MCQVRTLGIESACAVLDLRLRVKGLGSKAWIFCASICAQATAVSLSRPASVYVLFLFKMQLFFNNYRKFQIFVVPLGGVLKDCCILGSIRIPPSHGNFRMADGGNLAPSRTFKWLFRIEDLGVFVHQPFGKFYVPRSYIIADLHSRNPCTSSGSLSGCRIYGLGLRTMVPPRIPIKNHT